MQMQIVPGWLLSDGFPYHFLQFLIRCHGSECLFDIDLLIREEAVSQPPVRCEPDAIAGVTEMLAQGADETYLTLSIPDTETPGRTMLVRS